jgi:hypothetical protein
VYQLLHELSTKGKKLAEHINTKKLLDEADEKELEKLVKALKK